MARIARGGVAFPLACVANNIFAESPGWSKKSLAIRCPADQLEFE